MDFGEFFEQGTLVPAFDPVDMHTGANNGIWVSMKNYNRMVAVLFKGAGTAGQDPVFTLKQAQDSSGTNAKALNFTRIREKIGATSDLTTSDFTLVTQASANTAQPTSAADSAIIAVDIKASDLDVQGGFSWVQLSVPSVGANAQLGAGFYIMFQARFAQQTPPEAIS
jgi:hypothetical protein